MKILRKWWFWVIILAITIAVILFYNPSLNTNNKICGFETSEYCDKSCNVDEDCKFTCACGFINVNENCADEGTVMCEYFPILLRCIDGECVNDKNPQLDCAGSCKCMKECNEQGPVYFISNENASKEECFYNLENKICCCSGV